MPEPKFYWADVTVKVMAESLDMAHATVTDAAIQMEGIYPGEIVVKGIEVDGSDEDDRIERPTPPTLPLNVIPLRRGPV